MPLVVKPQLAIPDADLSVRFGQSRGPGGQNVNKVATRVELRLHLDATAALSAEVKQRLRQRNQRRLSADGDLIVTSDRFRSQARNREDADQKLIELIQAALRRPKPRRPTHVPPREKRHRLDAKKRRSAIKKNRRSSADD